METRAPPRRRRYVIMRSPGDDPEFGYRFLIATGVNGDGHREVLGMRVATSETGAAWNEFFADLVARGLAGVVDGGCAAHPRSRRYRQGLATSVLAGERTRPDSPMVPPQPPG